MNVVSNCDSSASGICQKPEFASTLEKMVAPLSCASVSSTGGIGNVSRRTPSFKGLRSTHILTLPDFFGTTTMPAHQGVGSVTFLMTPNAIELILHLCSQWNGDISSSKESTGTHIILHFNSVFSPQVT